jgi:hypothetical protein
MTVSSSPSPLLIFCGKGGVGKSTLSLALGLWYARAGRSVLVVSSHPLPELAVSISLSGLKERHPEAAANLFIVHIDPREILGNKVRQQIPSDLLARTVISSRLYQNLIEVAPGLKELAFLTRLRQLAEGKLREGVTRRYDLMIWDAPATGHFLQTLKVSRNFDTYLSGPFAVMGKDLIRFLSDPARIRILPVTILEEMAVAETAEMCDELKNELGMPPTALVCNLASPLLSSSEDAFLDLRGELAAWNCESADWKFILDRHAIERQLLKKLRDSVPVPHCVVERATHWNSELDLLDALAAALGASLTDIW